MMTFLIELNPTEKNGPGIIGLLTVDTEVLRAIRSEAAPLNRLASIDSIGIAIGSSFTLCRISREKMSESEKSCEQFETLTKQGFIEVPESSRFPLDYRITEPKLRINTSLKLKKELMLEISAYNGRDGSLCEAQIEIA